MFLLKARFYSVFLIVFVLLMVGCSSSGEPKLIAGFPADDNQPSTERYLPPPDQGLIVYNADIEVEVTNPDKSADQAKELTAELGGYLVSSTSWRQQGERYYRLVLAVPVIYFDELRDALVNLGRLKRESVWGEKVRYDLGGRHNFSTITLQLVSRTRIWSGFQIRGWNPGLTFQRALDVFITIFGFVMDILIWVGVVAGPFALIGWVIWFLARRGRNSRQRAADEEPGG